jgi:hypothetical protein
MLPTGCKTGDKSVDQEVASDVCKMHAFVGELRRRAGVSAHRWGVLVEQGRELEDLDVGRGVIG